MSAFLISILTGVAQKLIEKLMTFIGLWTKRKAKRLKKKKEGKQTIKNINEAKESGDEDSYNTNIDSL